jgi:hypothetical protein
MTEYMLSVHHDEPVDTTAMAEAEMQEVFAAVEAFNEEVRQAGAWVFAGGLQPPTSATTVRLSGSDTLLTDGPWAETKEFLGGFWVIEAADLDEALAWARKGAVACRGDVEVRPFQGEPEG